MHVRDDSLYLRQTFSKKIINASLIFCHLVQFDRNIYISWYLTYIFWIYVCFRFTNLFLFKLSLNIMCHMITNPFILNSTFDQNISFLREHYGLSVDSSYRMKHRVRTIIIQVQKFKFRYLRRPQKFGPFSIFNLTLLNFERTFWYL